MIILISINQSTHYFCQSFSLNISKGVKKCPPQVEPNVKTAQNRKSSLSPTVWIMSLSFASSRVEFIYVAQITFHKFASRGFRVSTAYSCVYVYVLFPGTKNCMTSDIFCRWTEAFSTISSRKQVLLKFCHQTEAPPLETCLRTFLSTNDNPGWRIPVLSLMSLQSKCCFTPPTPMSRPSLQLPKGISKGLLFKGFYTHKLIELIKL